MFGMGDTPSLAWREHCKQLLFFTGFHLAITSNSFYVCLSPFPCVALTEFVTQSSRKISFNIPPRFFAVNKVDDAGSNTVSIGTRRARTGAVTS